MRKKIEELRNREEGFTLVELLAVIVILGIIVAIAIPAIGNVIQKAQSDSDAAEEQLIIDAARLYQTSEATDEDVHTDTLIAEGYLAERNDGGIPSGLVKTNDEGNLEFVEGAADPAAPADPDL